MNFTVTGITVETKGLSAEQLEQAKIFSGKNAGICYMGDSYFDSAVSDPAKALPRFTSTAKMAHHSISDHVRVEVLLEGISKMMAIILNSLQDYATSEKSGRYTVMTGNSADECRLYEKWCDIFENRLLQLSPSINDGFLYKSFNREKPNLGYKVKEGRLIADEGDVVDIEINRFFEDKIATNKSKPSRKLAQENARYVLSVFTRSTTMGYSTSLRQWNYIYDWCQKYLSQFMPRYDKAYVDAMSGRGGEVVIVYKGTDTPVTFFEHELYFDMLNLSNFIFENLYIEELRDTKNRYFEFLVNGSGADFHPMSNYNLGVFEPDGYTGEFLYSENDHSEDDIIDTMYQVAYPASFVHIAQAERHRTLQYFMFYNPHSTVSNWFIPPMIRGTEYEEMWVNDLESVKDIVPQATQVMIVETGHISKFLLKCEERLCSKAQWEIMNQTKRTAERFLAKVDSGNCSTLFKGYAEQLRSRTKGVTTKCQMLGKCFESCGMTVDEALSRKY